MFIDEADIIVEGGKGGDGKVAYFANRKGPSGGNGGRGGNLYIVVNTNMSTLKKYTEVVEYKAEDGQEGGPNKRLGRAGKDLFLQVPIGTTVINLDTHQELELNHPSSSFLICRGGKLGRGNASFKTSTNRTPKNAEKGTKGDSFHLKLLIKLIADFGLIGLPNAGKSSLLNALTASKAKIANYPFTTLEPNLGALGKKIIADIPGLIEGASAGKGLGIKFLKHIEKVQLLLHCISAESDNLTKDYLTVITELGNYNEKLPKKDTIILLTKTDLIPPKDLKKKIAELTAFQHQIIPLSIYDERLINSLKDILMKKSTTTS